jgi:hypothetical protein
MPGPLVHTGPRRAKTKNTTMKTLITAMAT